jgi:hypothetical protein
LRTIKITERGWIGHFCCAADCLFRRNTLVDGGSVKVVVSTVGLLYRDGKYHTLDINKSYYETMAFLANDSQFNDADVSRQIELRGRSNISDVKDEIGANRMHDEAVREIKKRIKNEEITN